MINSARKNNYQWAISVVIILYSYLWPCNAWNLIGYRKVSSCRSMSMDYDEDNTTTMQSKKRKSRIRPHRLSSIENIHQVRKLEAQELKEKVLHDPNLFSNVKFKDREDIHPSTKRAIIEILKLQEMTQIQLQSYPHILKGKNVVGRSKTGTGKTLAYLLPSMQRLFLEDKNLYIPGKTIGILIIAPTRELVQQIASQATSILTFHSSDMTVVSMYGGVSIQRDIQLMSNHQNRLPTILVATPGRLLEHLGHTKLGPRKFCDILDSTKILVLDEMDRLLDMGFQRDVSRILSFLPRNRQNLLFSATTSKSTKSEIHKLLGNNYEEVNCVAECDEITVTSNQIEQSYLILDSMDQYIPTLILLIRNELESSKTNVKILIFLPTTWLVSLVVECFKSTLKNIHILQLHSRLSQSARQRTSDSFRTTQLPSILVSTDISSRGMDYPDVSLVLQYGYPDKDDTYLHRLGRTGRAGRGGKGIQVLLPFEHYRISKLQKQGVNKITELSQSPNTDSSMDTTKISIGIMEAAVKSFLAYYLEQAPKMKMTPIDIIQQATALANSLGLSKLPTMSTKTATRLGIEDLIPMEEEF
jgi:ATP-dependent RNA helicase MSS116, mitochondrial